MCGIAGIVGLKAAPEQLGEYVGAMTARIRHRGPDGGGVAVHPEATIGMARLAIVDVCHGHQPMFSDDRSIVLVYNGEIYNAPEIRRELQRSGVRFRTRSDTEVILRLYERDPDRVEEYLVGMWAFAIHDRRRRQVVLSRDRFGIKPLFVADAGTALAFASELRCFDRSLGPFSRLFTIDHDAAHAMVSWSYVPERSTIYQGVRRLPPASRIVVELENGHRATRTYWTLEPSGDAARVRSLDEACERVEQLLRQSVAEHLESDVPVAAFLSGGIDSSLVTAYAHEASGGRITAYSVGFEERHFDESPFARETAKKIGAPIHVAVLDEDKARRQLVDALLAYDEPFGDSSNLATYILSQQVARDFKVALGGDGGDEVFAGYKKYKVVQMRRPFSAVPRLRDLLAGSIARGLLGHVPVRHDHLSGWDELLRKLRRWSAALDGPDAYVYAQLTQFAPLMRTAILMQRPATASRFEEEARARFDIATGNELQKSIACDLGSALCNDMLVKVDRASMACSLEARVPYLDHRLVEFAVGLPEAYTLGAPTGAATGKRVLRTLHERRFGRPLARRKKQGFSVPVGEWLRGPFDRACERLFEKRRLDSYGLLSSDALSHGGHRSWAASDPSILWHAFALAAWCETTLGDGPDALRETLAVNGTPARGHRGAPPS